MESTLKHKSGNSFFFKKQFVLVNEASSFRTQRAEVRRTQAHHAER